MRLSNFEKSGSKNEYIWSFFFELKNLVYDSDAASGKLDKGINSELCKPQRYFVLLDSFISKKVVSILSFFVLNNSLGFSSSLKNKFDNITEGESSPELVNILFRYRSAASLSLVVYLLISTITSFLNLFPFLKLIYRFSKFKIDSLLAKYGSANAMA